MRISDWSSDVCSSDLRLRELQALRFRVVRCDQNDLKRAIGALGRIDQSGHVRSAAGNENGDFGFLSHHYSRESGNPFPGLASGMGFRRSAIRSEEHTSELQSLMRISYAVFCLKT